jgi:hypothetical protein
MTLLRTTLANSLIIGGLAMIAQATASPRTVCFNLKFSDARYNCPAPGTAGALRGCQAGSDVDAVGHQIELWDKDDNRPDGLIGTWYIGGEGTQCATFEWENSPASAGKPNPDVYMRYINRVNRTGFANYLFAVAVKTDGSPHPAQPGAMASQATLTATSPGTARQEQHATCFLRVLFYQLEMLRRSGHVESWH